MRLVTVILTLGLGLCGPPMIDGEKVVFVVPRYLRRSWSGSSSPFYSHGEGGYKMGHSMRRPHFRGHQSGPSPDTTEQFFPREKYREEFNQPEFSVPNRAVNHVVIPHGKGISHGVSFGKEFAPDVKAMNEDFDFHSEDGNKLEFKEQSHHRDVKFEGEGFPGFREQSQDWPFGQQESVHQVHQGQPRFEAPEFRGREEPAVLKEELLVQKTPREDSSPEIPPPAAPTAMPAQERSRAPIILQDTIDMREYVEKVQAFAKSWPAAAAAGINSFAWKNSPGVQTTPNFYQGYNSWTSSLARTPGGYKVQEESQEEPNRHSFGAVMT